MSAYDRWLEKPYQDQADEAAAYERFCEEQGIEFDHAESEAAWERYKEEMESEAEREMEVLYDYEDELARAEAYDDWIGDE
jgi:hypothetical protein